MAEQLILVCDICGQPASESVNMKVNGQSYVKDYCRTHLSELLSGARKPKRGRRPGSTAGNGSSRRSRRGQKTESSSRSGRQRRARKTEEAA